MKYQLVIQFPASSINDYDAMIELEESIETALGSDHVLDGHDFGSGEMNIFIHTNDPELAFYCSMKSRALNCSDSFLAAYRAFTSDEYKVIWPSDFSGEFNVA